MFPPRSARLGIAGAIREKNSVGLQRKHIFRAGLRRDDRNLAALSRQHAQNVLLDAEVVGHHMKRSRLVFHADDFLWSSGPRSRIPTHIAA